MNLNSRQYHSFSCIGYATFASSSVSECDTRPSFQRKVASVSTCFACEARPHIPLLIPGDCTCMCMNVPCRVSSDPGPLRRVEHIVYMAAFFNLEAKALEFYAQVEAEYEKLVTPAGPNSPVMAWVDHTPMNSFYTDADGNMLEGQVYRISFAPYKVALTSDCGANALDQSAIVEEPAFALGDDIYFAESSYPTLMAAQAAMKDVLKGVDILIDESFTFGNNLVRHSYLQGHCVSPVLHPPQLPSCCPCSLADSQLIMLLQSRYSASLTGSVCWFLPRADSHRCICCTPGSLMTSHQRPLITAQRGDRHTRTCMLISLLFGLISPAPLCIACSCLLLGFSVDLGVVFICTPVALHHAP